jgi:hypothetical protein
MNETLTRSFFLVFICCGLTTHAQTVVNGMVADSATLLPLANVNVVIQNKPDGTVSTAHGYFSLNVSDSDTVFFSRVGYHILRYPVKKLKEQVVIYMREEKRVLNEIVITPEFKIPGLPIIPKESHFINPTQTKAYNETPGVPTMQTFGLGYTFKGVISRFTKYEKERKKLPRLKAQNQKAKGYTSVMSDPELKADIMKVYNVSENEFYRILALFNEKNRDSIYELGANDLISFLYLFFAEQEKNKK